MKPRIFRRHPLNVHLERATIAEGISKQKSHPFKVMQKRQLCGFGMVMCMSQMHSTLIKAIGYMTGVIEILC